MRRFVYYSIFVPVAVASVANTLLLLVADVAPDVASKFQQIAFSLFFREFGNPVPAWVKHWVPAWFQTVLVWALFALIVRRLYVSLRAHALTLPESLSGLLYFLVWLPFVSLWLGILALALSIALRFGSGVPAGMVLLPAFLLSGFSVLLVEALAFRSRRAEPRFSATTPNPRP